MFLYAKDFKSNAEDDEWKHFPKIIKQTKSDVLPIYFDGKNGEIQSTSQKSKIEVQVYLTFIIKNVINVLERIFSITNSRECHKMSFLISLIIETLFLLENI